MCGQAVGRNTLVILGPVVTQAHTFQVYRQHQIIRDATGASRVPPGSIPHSRLFRDDPLPWQSALVQFEEQTRESTSSFKILVNFPAPVIFR